MNTTEATLNYRFNDADAEDCGRRWLVQLHPIQLDQGPIEVTEQTTTLGRSNTSTIMIDEESVSRHHAEIRRTEAGFQLIDMGSTNGVLVNDQSVQTAYLKSGDRLQLGARVYRFLANSDFESQYHETVYSMMTRDSLTGVYNKRYLLECLQREVSRCVRHQRPVAVVLLDVDHFKRINDTHGHLVGDEVLRELARRLQAELSDDEVLARFGGEEFAIVMVESDIAQARLVAERCRSAIGLNPFDVATGILEVSISLGISAPPIEQLMSVEQLLSEADVKLYEAKRTGRNRVVG